MTVSFCGALVGAPSEDSCSQPSERVAGAVSKVGEKFVMGETGFSKQLRQLGVLGDSRFQCEQTAALARAFARFIRFAAAQIVRGFGNDFANRLHS